MKYRTLSNHVLYFVTTVLYEVFGAACSLLLYVWSSHYTYNKSTSMDRPDKAANPARGQLNRENEYFLVSGGAGEFGLARRVRPSRPASAYSFSILSLNLVPTHGIPPDSRGSPLGQSRVSRVKHLRTVGVHCRESAGPGPVVLKVIPVTGAAFPGHHGPVDVCALLNSKSCQ